MSVVGTEKRQVVIRTYELVVEVYQQMSDLGSDCRGGSRRGKREETKFPGRQQPGYYYIYLGSAFNDADDTE